MATLGSRKGSAEQLTLPLMILAFVLAGGFPLLAEHYGRADAGHHR